MKSLRQVGLLGLLAAGVSGIADKILTGAISPFRGLGFAGPTHSRKGGRDKSHLPRFYPGAKLARKAAEGKLGKCHV
jgi:hypothetical protein